jgi:hypothetical protein
VSSRQRRAALRQLRDDAKPAARLSQAVLGILLLVAAVAFVRAEQLKLEHGPIAGPHVHTVFSARCNGGAKCVRQALLRFRLRRPAVVSLAIVDADGRVVRRLGPARQRPRGTVRARWNGRTEAGRVAPDGRYHLRVDLRSLGRVVTIPDAIVLDSTWPRAHITSLRSRRVRGGVRIEVRYATSEPLHSSFLVLRRGAAPGGQVLLLRRGHHGIAAIVARGLAPGRYRLELHASDAAGNAVARPPARVVTLP